LIFPFKNLNLLYLSIINATRPEALGSAVTGSGLEVEPQAGIGYIMDLGELEDPWDPGARGSGRSIESIRYKGIYKSIAFFR
jgi:hypothetical protein